MSAPPTRSAAISSAPRRSRRSRRWVSICPPRRRSRRCVWCTASDWRPRVCRSPRAGVTRRVLDEALLRQAAASGATVLRGHSASARSQTGWHRCESIADALGRIVADTVFLATGKHELRGVARASRGTGLVGMKMYYTLAAAQLAALRQPRRTDPVRRRLCRPAACRSRIGPCCACCCPRAGCAPSGGRWDSLLRRR